MKFLFLANRRLWFATGFALLLLLSVFNALTETTLGAPLDFQLYFPLIFNGFDKVYLPLIFKGIKLCGTIPC